MTFIRNHQKSEHINFIEVLDILPLHSMEYKRSKLLATSTEDYITNVSLFSFDISFHIPFQEIILWLKIANMQTYQYEYYDLSVTLMN